MKTDPEPRSDVEQTPIRLLIIEDNQQYVELLSDVFKQSSHHRYRTVHAPTLTTGLEELNTGEFDLVLLDLGLPDSEALDTFRAVHSAHPEIPVVILTVFDDDEVADKAIQLGAQDYLVKGKFSPWLLDRLITNAIERHRLKRQSSEQARRLGESEARYRFIFENLNDGIALVDPEERFVFANPAADRIFGVETGRLAGKTLADFMTPETFEQMKELTRLRRKGVSGRYRTEIIRPNGQKRIITFVAEPWCDEDGEFLGTLGIIHDDTDFIEIETALGRSEERYRLLIDTMNEGLLLIDTDNKITFVNSKVCEIAKCTETDLIGRSIFEFVDEENRKILVKQSAKRRKGASEPYEVELTKGGDKMSALVSPQPIFDEEGRFHGTVVVLTDITKRKLMEQELQAYQNQLEEMVENRTKELKASNERLRKEVVERKRIEEALARERDLLEQRVAERTHELQAINDELEQANRLKDEFLANMSHELRTPLNTVIGMTEALREGVFGKLNPEQLEAAVNIEKSGHHLLELINDILELTKIEAGKISLTMEEISVDSVCRASMRLVRNLAKEKHIDLSFTLSPDVSIIRADLHGLKQILVNLLNNAVKFSPEGGAVGLKVEKSPEDRDVRFIVSDTGIGISKDDMTRLFKPFTQIDGGYTRKYPGTGLGLSLVKRMVDLHGGTISVKSEPGKGSVFTVSLPLEPVYTDRATNQT